MGRRIDQTFTGAEISAYESETHCAVDYQEHYSGTLLTTDCSFTNPVIRPAGSSPMTDASCGRSREKKVRRKSPIADVGRNSEQPERRWKQDSN